MILENIARWTDRAWYWLRGQKAKPEPLLPESCRRGDHDWRVIAAPYVKQCKRLACGLVQYRDDSKGDFPDGLAEYVNLMTRPGGLPKPHDFPHSFKPTGRAGPKIHGQETEECGICMQPGFAGYHCYPPNGAKA